MNNIKDGNPKTAFGVQKPYFSVIPGQVLAEIGLAMLEGACKYGSHNYRKDGALYSVYFNAAMRHLWRAWEGEDTDPDSGLSHITKAISSLVVLRDSLITGNAIDDRPLKGDSEWFEGVEEATKRILDSYPNPKPFFTSKGRVDNVIINDVVPGFEYAIPNDLGEDGTPLGF